MKSILAVFALSGLWLAAVAAGPQSFRTASTQITYLCPPPTPTPRVSPTPPSSPSATPTPRSTSQASINLSDAAGQIGSVLVVTGSGFPTGQPLGIYLDQAGNGMGPVFCAAPDGSFRQSVTIPFFARTGDRQVCATSLVAVACARFQVLPITNAAPTPAATPVATPVPTPVPTATLVPGPTPTETASPSAATIGPATITGTPLGSSALSTLFPWILIPIAALLALAGLVVWLLRRGQSTPPGARRKFGPTGGSGIPTITHRSPQPIGSMPGARRRGEPPPDRPLTVEWMPGDPLPNEPPPAGLPPVPQNELISAPDEPAGRRAEPGADDGASVQSGSPIITHRSPQPFGGLPAADPGPPAGGDKPE